MNATTSRRKFLKVGAASALIATSASCSTTDRDSAHSALPFTSWGFAEERSNVALRKISDVYTESTGRDIDERVYPYDKYLNQLVLAARGGRMTGIVHIDEEWMSALATADVIINLGAQIGRASWRERAQAYMRAYRID